MSDVTITVSDEEKLKNLELWADIFSISDPEDSEEVESVYEYVPGGEEESEKIAE